MEKLKTNTIGCIQFRFEAEVRQIPFHFHHQNRIVHGHNTIYDTTLRDGSQAKGISFSLQDKISIATMLDEFGALEAGWPNPTNPTDVEFYEQARKMEEESKSRYLVLPVALAKPSEDEGLAHLVASKAQFSLFLKKLGLTRH